VSMQVLRRPLWLVHAHGDVVKQVVAFKPDIIACSYRNFLMVDTGHSILCMTSQCYIYASMVTTLSLLIHLAPGKLHARLVAFTTSSNACLHTC